MPTNTSPAEPQRIQVKLGDVQETLLIPLYMRALETRRENATLSDPKSLEIVDAIDYDFARFDKEWKMQMDIAARTEILDEQLSKFLTNRPDAVVVNLGAGLDGRFWRLDNGQMRWFDIDMPDSMDLRRQFYSESDRVRFMPQSMFDYSWIDALGDVDGEQVIILAEGLFCYFDEELLRELFGQIADRLPGAQIVFQSISPRWVNYEHQVPAVSVTNATFKWGIKTARSMQSWDDRIEFVDEWGFIDRQRHRWRWLRWVTLFPPVRTYMREVMKISHLRFRPKSKS